MKDADMDTGMVMDPDTVYEDAKIAPNTRQLTVTAHK